MGDGRQQTLTQLAWDIIFSKPLRLFFHSVCVSCPVCIVHVSSCMAHLQRQGNKSIGHEEIQPPVRKREGGMEGG